ncbi:MAG: methionyl-tRNA formyltransferase [Bacteroidetes bacterium]|nr:methionyl-tRNA formyltransferase [Bacteroidota bacterium]MCL1969302.1 methionyl-tRNA formyltransferase [Bacteroidota bacterium]
MRVVFMGTPDFAVASLDAIYHSEHETVGVVTVPDKPAGRGLQMQSSEVKKYAVEHHIPVLQPVKLKNTEFIEALKQWRADIFVVVAFRMLPVEVYDIPPKGAFNVHASLLPQYRGAAPIHWAIMNGETKTGVTTFFLNNEMDCGDIILQRETDILPNETTGELYDRLKLMGAEVALQTLSLVEKENVKFLSQSHIENAAIKLAPKIHKEDTIIDWNLPAKDIINKIRGLSPYPGAVTFLKTTEGTKIAIKIFEAAVTSEISNENAGKIDTDDKKFFHISSKDFKISIQNLQLEGKKRLKVDSFLQGYKVSNYTI